MRIDPLKLRISTPNPDVVPGRGFYQLEECSLYVPIGYQKSRRFFSFLESERVRFDIDKDGRLMFIEINAARHTWKVNAIALPLNNENSADIRWLGFRTQISEPEIFCDKSRQIVMIQFEYSEHVKPYRLADSVWIQVNQEDNLSSIIIKDISDDLAGLDMAKYCSSFEEIKKAEDNLQP